MSELNLKKLFVLVPSKLTTVTLDAVKTKSHEPANSDKLYFVEKYNQIVKDGVTYGIDPKTFKEIEKGNDEVKNEDNNESNFIENEEEEPEEKQNYEDEDIEMGDNKKK